MFAKPEWFGPRKYTGWGLSPRTWQGWVYLLLVVVLVAAATAVPLDKNWRFLLILIVVGTAAVDLIAVSLKIKLDERERLHGAIADRNALWAMIGLAAIVVVYQAITSAADNARKIDPLFLGILLAGLAAKALTNLYLDRKD